MKCTRESRLYFDPIREELYLYCGTRKESGCQYGTDLGHWPTLSEVVQAEREHHEREL